MLQAGLTPATSCLATHGAVEGRVLSAADGRPIVGAVVATTPATVTALTDAGGRFEIAGIPLDATERRLSVTAVKPGFSAASTVVSLDPVSARVEVDLPLVPIGSPPSSGATLSVRVLHRDAPVRGARVEVLHPSGERVAETTSDAEGFALFGEVEPGSWTVRGSATIAGRPFEGFAGITIEPGRDALVEVHLRQVF